MPRKAKKAKAAADAVQSNGNGTLAPDARFLKVAGRRLGDAEKVMSLLCNVFGNGYESNADQRAMIVQRLKAGVAKVERAATATGRGGKPAAPRPFVDLSV